MKGGLAGRRRRAADHELRLEEEFVGGDGGAVDLAHQIAASPQAALRSDRRSSYEQWSLALPEALGNEYDHGMATLATGETFTGVARYVALRADRADSEYRAGTTWADAASTRKRST